MQWRLNLGNSGLMEGLGETAATAVVTESRNSAMNTETVESKGKRKSGNTEKVGASVRACDLASPRALQVLSWYIK